MKKNIVIKGETQKNKSAVIAIVIGAILLVIAFLSPFIYINTVKVQITDMKCFRGFLRLIVWLTSSPSSSVSFLILRYTTVL